MTITQLQSFMLMSTVQCDTEMFGLKQLKMRIYLKLKIPRALAALRNNTATMLTLPRALHLAHKSHRLSPFTTQAIRAFHIKSNNGPTQTMTGKYRTQPKTRADVLAVDTITRARPLPIVSGVSRQFPRSRVFTSALQSKFDQSDAIAPCCSSTT